MSELKTRPTDADVEAFLDSAAQGQRREDCAAVVDIMRRVTGEEPRLWGTSIVGFGSYRYPAKGGTAEWLITGFSPRKTNLTLYIMTGFDRAPDLMAKLGSYKTGVSCLYLKKLDDIDRDVLTQLVTESVAAMRVRYPA